MKKGDLVKPLGSCGGNPGSRRCNVAMVVQSNHDKAEIVCPCGSAEVYRTQLEEVEPELAYSADPM